MDGGNTGVREKKTRRHAKDRFEIFKGGGDTTNQHKKGKVKVIKVEASENGVYPEIAHRQEVTIAFERH